jgi:hypothetical protein
MLTSAFLTIADLSDFVSDDELAMELLRERGWRVEHVPWNEDRDWSQFDLAVIRTTWNYQQNPALFLRTLGEIERSGARLINSLSLVRWNLNKRYLGELDTKGVPIVPTEFGERLNGRDSLVNHFLKFDTDELILKPLISANAEHTFRIPRAEYESFLPGLTAVFENRPYLAQPFMPRIRDEGEFSLIYFNGRFSHAILKTPASGDFRVQEEHGGVITAVTPEDALLEAGQRAMEAVEELPLYGRVDLVRDGDIFRVMELEFIEPSLYLRMDSEAPQRFVDALTAVVNS